MQQRLEQLRLEEERRKQEEEEKQRALEEAENRRLEKVFIFFMPLCVSSRCKGENWFPGVLCNVFHNGCHWLIFELNTTCSQRQQMYIAYRPYLGVIFMYFKACLAQLYMNMWITLFSFIFAGLKFRENFLGTFHESLISRSRRKIVFAGNLISQN